jgi:hypothetical protein
MKVTRAEYILLLLSFFAILQGWSLHHDMPLSWLVPHTCTYSVCAADTSSCLLVMQLVWKLAYWQG